MRLAPSPGVPGSNGILRCGLASLHPRFDKYELERRRRGFQPLPIATGGIMFAGIDIASERHVLARLDDAGAAIGMLDCAARSGCQCSAPSGLIHGSAPSACACAPLESPQSSQSSPPCGNCSTPSTASQNTAGHSSPHSRGARCSPKIAQPSAPAEYEKNT
jgi:hypothetical protein